MKAQFFDRFKSVNDAASATASTHFRSAKFHRKNTIALKADVLDTQNLTGLLFGRRCLDDGRACLAAEKQRGGIAFGVAADEQNPLAQLRHHG